MIKITINGRNSFVKESNVYIEEVANPLLAKVQDSGTLYGRLSDRLGEEGKIVLNPLSSFLNAKNGIYARAGLLVLLKRLKEKGASDLACTRVKNLVEYASKPVTGTKIMLEENRCALMFPLDKIEINGEPLTYSQAVVKLKSLVIQRETTDYALNQETLSKIVSDLVSSNMKVQMQTLKTRESETNMALEFYRANKNIDDKKIKAFEYYDEDLRKTRETVDGFRDGVVGTIRGYRDSTADLIKDYKDSTDKQIQEYMDCRNENIRLRHELALQKTMTKSAQESFNYYKEKSDHYDFTMMKVTKILVEMDGLFSSSYGILCDKFFEGELTKATFDSYLRNKKKELYKELKKIYNLDTNMLTKESTDSILDYIEKELKVIREAKESLMELPSTEELLAEVDKTPASELLDRINVFKKLRKQREEM